MGIYRRRKFIFRNLITHLHQFINETRCAYALSIYIVIVLNDNSITTDEWMSTIQFLTRTGQICTPIRQEFILLSDVLGVSALVDALNNPPVSGGTESSVLGPFFTEDAPDGACAARSLRSPVSDHPPPASSQQRRFYCVRGQGRVHVRGGPCNRHAREARA